MSNVTILYVGNDTVLEVKGLKNEVTGAFLNAATVTAILIDAEGDQVGGHDWPATLAYVANSDGLYRATLPYGMDLTSGGRYTAQITANAGNGLRASWAISCLARQRN